MTKMAYIYIPCKTFISMRSYTRHEDKLNIPNVYRNQFFIQFMLGWVSGQLQKGGSVTEAVQEMIDWFGIDDMHDKNLARVYYMKHKELRKALRSTDGLSLSIDDVCEDMLTEVHAKVEEILKHLKKDDG